MTARRMLPILAAVALAAWGALAAPAEAPATDFEYKRNGKNITLAKYKGSASELVIPEKIDKFPVTELGENLFKGNTDLVRVSIPDTVMWLGHVVFQACSNLESVKMSKNIKGIGYGCFERCGNLKEISFPKRISVGGGGAFCACHSLDTLITGDGTQLLRIGAGVREYTVPAPIQEIAPSAFQNTPIECVVFQKGTTHILERAFKGCKNLESVTLPQTLEFIRYQAFCDCLSLTNVTFMGDCPKTEKDLFLDSPDVTVYYDPSARGWKPDRDGRWAEHGVPLVPLDKPKGGQSARPLKPLLPQQPAAPAPAVAEAAPAPVAAAIQPPANTMPATAFAALYAEKFPQFPPALLKLRVIFTNETAKIDLDRVRGHAAALGDYAASLDKLTPVFVQKADLDGVKAVDAAKELTFRGEVDTSGTCPEIAALAATYAKRCAAANAKAADAVVALTGKYTKALTASLRELLQKKDLPTAELYKLEIDAADRARYAAQTGKRN